MGFRRITVFSMIAVGFGLPGCGDPAEPPPTAARAMTAHAEELPNIIVLTVDTLRADHLARYGYPRETMPTIENFADTAVVFDQAVVPRGSTRPSYASILTGLYPFRHGVRSNGAVLHADLFTLPEMIGAVGYHTAAFVSNFVLLGDLSNCSQGFDVYDDQLGDREAHRPNFERTAAGTLKAILEWLESDPPQPFFLFTNFIDPHGPYEPPQRFREMYQSRERRMLKLHQIPYYQQTPGVRDFYDFLDRYDGEVRFTDEALAILIDELKTRHLWDDALVVFTADHGESMGEHDLFFEHHQNLWEATTRVPLMIRLPIDKEDEAVPPLRISAISEHRFRSNLNGHFGRS
ncbi:sulfatase [bacterium]|nr:sulfatase [bacterium]